MSNDTFDEAPFMEEGRVSEPLDRDNDLIGSIIDGFRARPSVPQLPRGMEGSPLEGSSSTTEKPYISLFDDPLHFLQRESKLQQRRLDELADEHEAALLKGSSRVNSIRRELAELLRQMEQGKQAMRELYGVEASRKGEIVSQLEALENRKSDLDIVIEDIEQNTPEGKTYAQLHTQVQEYDKEIAAVEAQLENLRVKRRTVNRQMLQSQSLLQAKTNGYVESRQKIEDEETRQTRGIAGQAGQSATVVIDTLKSQIASMNDLIEDSRQEEAALHASGVYLADVVEEILKMEKTLQLQIKAGASKDKLVDQLSTTRTYLRDRVRECQRMNMDMGFTKRVITAEIGTLDKAVKLLTGEEDTESDKSDNSVATPGSSMELAHEQPKMPKLTKTKESSLSISSSFAPPVVTAAVVTQDVTKKKAKEAKYTKLLARMKVDKGQKRD